jgi:hypothetical protein
MLWADRPRGQCALKTEAAGRTIGQLRYSAPSHIDEPKFALRQ